MSPGENIAKPVVELAHSRLMPWEDGAFKRECPFCYRGLFLVLRALSGVIQLQDRCCNCGQEVLYTDIEPGHKILKYKYPYFLIPMEKFIPNTKTNKQDA